MLISTDLSAMQSLETFFKKNGASNVTKVQSGEAGWSLLQEETFNLIFSSWNLYELSGINLLKIVRRDSRFWDIPFFLSKSNFSKEDVILAGQSGVSGLLVEPCNVDNLFYKLIRLNEHNDNVETLEVKQKLSKGLALIEAGDYTKSLEVLNDLVEKGESAEVYYNIGYIKSVQGKYSEAIEAFKMATVVDRLYAQAYKALGKIYNKLGNQDMAEQYLQKAADIYLSSQKDQEAEDVLREVIKIKPDTHNAYNSLGVLYRKKGDTDKALLFYKKALKIQPNGSHVHYNIGKLYLYLKNFNMAKVHIKRALELNPGYDDLKIILDRLAKVS